MGKGRCVTKEVGNRCSIASVSTILVAVGQLVTRFWNHTTCSHVFHFFQPYNHQQKIAKYYYASPEIINNAIENALSVRAEWERRPMQDRTQIFLKAADMIANERRADILAATMVGQVGIKLLFRKSLITWLWKMSTGEEYHSSWNWCWTRACRFLSFQCRVCHGYGRPAAH